MTDIAVLSIIYLIVTALAFWSVQSFFKTIELENSLEISIQIKIKLSFVFSTMYLLPLLFVKALGTEALFLYFLTIPISIISIRKLPQNSISLKSAVSVFWGVSAKLIIAMLVMGAIARLIMRFFKG